MYGEEKIFCTGPTGAAKAGQKSREMARSAQRTFEPRKDPFNMYVVLLETPIASVSTVSRGHPSLITLMLANEKFAGVINTRIKGTHEGGGGSH